VEKGSCGKQLLELGSRDLIFDTSVFLWLLQLILEMKYLKCPYVLKSCINVDVK
jgi:hypothetical protein